MKKTFIEVSCEDVPKLAAMNIAAGVLLALLDGASTRDAIVDAVHRDGSASPDRTAVTRALRKLDQAGLVTASPGQRWALVPRAPTTVDKLLGVALDHVSSRVPPGTGVHVPDAWLAPIAALDQAIALFLLALRVRLTEAALFAASRRLSWGLRSQRTALAARLREAGLEVGAEATVVEGSRPRRRRRPMRRWLPCLRGWLRRTRRRARLAMRRRRPCSSRQRAPCRSRRLP